MRRRAIEMVIALLGTITLLAGCTGTTVKNARVLDKDVKPVASLRVLYIENSISFDNKNDLAWVPLYGLGYEDLGYLLRERVPKVLRASGLVGEIETVKRTDLNNQDTKLIREWAQRKGAGGSVLILEMVGGGASINTMHASSITSLVLEARLLNPQNMAVQWKGSFENTLRKSVLTKNRFDFGFVDGMVKQILDRMALDKLVVLSSAATGSPNVATNCDASPPPRFYEKKALDAENLARVSPDLKMPEGKMLITHIDGKSTYRCDIGNLGEGLVRPGRHTFVVDIVVPGIVASKSDRWQQTIWEKSRLPKSMRVFYPGGLPSVRHTSQVDEFLSTHENAIEVEADIEAGFIYRITYGMEPGENGKRLHRVWVTKNSAIDGSPK